MSGDKLEIIGTDNNSDSRSYIFIKDVEATSGAVDFDDLDGVEDIPNATNQVLTATGNGSATWEDAASGFDYLPDSGSDGAPVARTVNIDGTQTLD